MNQGLIVKALAAIFLLLIAGNVSAHKGGHYHRSHGDVLNTWRLKDGQTIKGNFFAGTGEYITLEQYDGKTVQLRINQLAEHDQALAHFKVEKYKKLNQSIPYFTTETSIITGKEFHVAWFVMACLFASVLLFLVIKLLVRFQGARQYQLTYKYILSHLFVISIAAVACKKSADNINTPTTSVIPKTSSSFIDSAFSPYKPTISTSWDNDYFYVASTGFPQHNMMVGITSWQQQVSIPQYYTGSNSWSIPLQPVYASVPLSTKTNLMKGAVAIAVNGIPIFNAYNNRGVDSYLTGELDNWGGHCGRADDYHYHAAPLHLSTSPGNMPIAFALDGFPVYGAKEPDGSPMQPLDTCHGHSINNAVYHYHGTTTYPYVIGAMRGSVHLDPNTPAPENQVIPQAFASPVRPALTPLNGAFITAFESTGINAYKLTYWQSTRFGYVEYNWNAANKYTYKITDTSGATTINVYQR